jgi:hypothetical protein
MSLLEQVYPLRALLNDKDEEEGQAILGWIADAGEVITFAANESIYLPGDPAEYLYLILDGILNLNAPTPRGNESYGLLETGDIFGIETTDPQGRYLLEAYSVEEGRLFCLGRETVLALMDENPHLKLPFQIMNQSIKMSLRVQLTWRGTDEAVHYISQRHPVFLMVRMLLPVILFFSGLSLLTFLGMANISGTLLPGLIAAAVALFSGLWGIWSYLDWENDYSVITSQNIAFQEKVILLYDSRLQAPLTAILSNKINSSQIGRIIGYGDLVMKTYTGTIAFPNISHPEIVVGFLEDRFKRMSTQHTEKEKKELRDRIRERLGYIESPAKKKKMPAPGNAPLSFREWMATIFRMRWESGTAITYRKHWLILLSYIILPSFFMAGLVLLVTLTIFGSIKILGTGPLMALEFVAFLVIGFWWWYQYEDWANDIYVVSDDTVVDIYKKPLGYEEKRTAEIRNIQSVEYDQENLAHLVFNFGDVRIRIGDTQFDFENVYNPSEVTADLFRRIDRRKGAEKKRADDEMHRHMVDLAESYHKVMGNPFEREDVKKKRR